MGREVAGREVTGREVTGRAETGFRTDGCRETCSLFKTQICVAILDREY